MIMQDQRRRVRFQYEIIRYFTKQSNESIRKAMKRRGMWNTSEDIARYLEQWFNKKISWSGLNNI